MTKGIVLKEAAKAIAVVRAITPAQRLVFANYQLPTFLYLREKRSKSAICEAISSRAASAAERIP